MFENKKYLMKMNSSFLKWVNWKKNKLQFLSYTIFFQPTNEQSFQFSMHSTPVYTTEKNLNVSHPAELFPDTHTNPKAHAIAPHATFYPKRTH